VFKLADIQGNRHVVQVFDKDEKKIYTTMLAVPNQRMEPSDKPIILFSERAAGSPQAVKVWYYPGETIGNEFVYPKTQAMKIAKESHTRVMAMNSDSKTVNTAGEIPADMRSANVGYFDENGTWQSDDGNKVAIANPPAATTTARTDTTPRTNTTPRTDTTPRTNTTARAQTTTAPTMATTTGSAGTSGSQPRRKHLPRTASSLALFELISGLSFAGGFAVRQLRQRLS